MRPILVRFNHSTDLIANRYRVVGLGLGAGSLILYVVQPPTPHPRLSFLHVLFLGGE